MKAAQWQDEIDSFLKYLEEHKSYKDKPLVVRPLIWPKTPPHELTFSLGRNGARRPLHLLGFLPGTCMIFSRIAPDFDPFLMVREKDLQSCPLSILYELDNERISNMHGSVTLAHLQPQPTRPSDTNIGYELSVHKSFWPDPLDAAMRLRY